MKLGPKNVVYLGSGAVCLIAVIAQVIGGGAWLLIAWGIVLLATVTLSRALHARQQ